jgi:hypothetical protein
MLKAWFDKTKLKAKASGRRVRSESAFGAVTTETLAIVRGIIFEMPLPCNESGRLFTRP